MDIYDYVIVGAGFSGLYCAYKLQKTGAKIAIIEKLPEISTEYNELDPIRYDPDLQPNLALLLKELNIESNPFHFYSSPFLAPNYNTLSLEEITIIEKNKDIVPCFALLKYALIKILDEQWDVENDSIKDPFRIAKKIWLKQNGKYGNEYLYKMGLWDTLATVLTKAALDYIIQYGTFYHSMFMNPNAIDMIIVILDILATSKQHYIYNKNTSSPYCINKKLQEIIKNDVHIFTNNRISAFLETNEKIVLSLDNAQIISCKHVVFTCSKKDLLNINGFEYYDYVYPIIQNSVFTRDIMKIYITIDNPPWNSSTCPYPNYGAHKIPCRELFYFYEEINNTGIILLNTDYPSINYWKAFTNSTLRMIEHLQKYIKCIFQGYHSFNITNVECKNQIFHMWNPGYSSIENSKMLLHFGKQRNVHICGETYSTYQGSIEGSIININQFITTC
jgi:hypothetical protein